MKGKELINTLVERYYERANTSKNNGEKVGWVTSNFPQEVIQTMDLCVIYPENHSATIAVKGLDKKYCFEAESVGLSNDLCSYAKVNLGYCLNQDKDDLKIPLPDYLLCCSNICHQLLKWYKYLEKKYDIPLVIIDIPYNTEYETDEIRYNYIKTQFYEAISDIEKITGNKFNEDKFKKVMEISNKSGNLWNKISDLLCDDTTSFFGTDLFNYMSIVVCQRGRKETVDALKVLYDELMNKNEKYKDKGKKISDYRILYEGICCWPGLMKLAVSFAEYGINMTSSIYTKAYGIEYKTFEDMILAYTYVPNAVSIERARDMRINEINNKNLDGMFVHMSRSCKIWSGIMYEMINQIDERTKIPIVMFDGDQADRRCFSEAQYDTRLQGFYELLKEK